MSTSALDLMEQRYSTRKFDGKPLDLEVKEKLLNFCSSLCPDTSVEAYIVEDNLSELFGFFLGYGNITQASGALIFVSEENKEFETGYTGEHVILEATALGLDTCWAAASFNKKKAAQLCGIELSEKKKILAISPLGHGVGIKTRTTRFDLEKIAPEFESFPIWAQRAAMAVHIAPSALNCQPWICSLEEHAFIISMVKKDKYALVWNHKKRKIDLGIAACHAHKICEENLGPCLVEVKENNTDFKVMIKPKDSF